MKKASVSIAITVAHGIPDITNARKDDFYKGEIIVRNWQIAVLSSLFCCKIFCTSVDIEVESAYRIAFADDIGYALIGAKPVSHDNLADMYLLTHPQARKKFISSLKDTFKSNDRFILKVFDFVDWHEIELINRKALRRLVSQSKVLNRFIHKNFGTEDAFYSKLEDSNTSIFDCDFGGDIIGTLFGYGEENPEHFCRVCELGDHLKIFPFVTALDTYVDEGRAVIPKNFPETLDLPYTTENPELGFGFDSFEAEWAWLQEVSWDFSAMIKESKAKPPYFINLPYYRCRKSAESDALRAKYVRARAKLAKLFSGKSYKQAVEDIVRSG